MNIRHVKERKVFFELINHFDGMRLHIGQTLAVARICDL
jgi:hypothetical protein